MRKDITTSWGSYLWYLDFTSPQWDLLIANAGKTHTTEFAAVTTAGPAANPHDPKRTPGGSSSGSGAVVGDFQVPIVSLKSLQD